MGEAVGQAEIGRDLGAVIAAAEDPDLRPRRHLRGMAATARKGWPSGSPSPSQPSRSLNLVREVGRRLRWHRGFSAKAVRPSLPGARPRPRSIRPGAMASATLNCSATFSAAVVRQHDAGGADADAAGGGGDGGDQHLGRRAGMGLSLLWCSASQ